MDGYDQGKDSLYTTPLNIGGPDATWNFVNLEDEPSPSYRPDRPRRHSSLPRVGFTSGVSSIFGSSAPTNRRDAPEQPPALTLNPPSQENLVTSSRQLYQLPTASKSRESWYENDDQTTVDRRHLPRVEKDADDPTTPPSSSRFDVNQRESTTLTRLSRLFAVRSPSSTETSRTPSYVQPNKPAFGYTRGLAGETAALPDHLYTRGLLEGRHSDITVNAFGNQYKLHRLILDRAPFFRSALSEPWLEANAKETTLHPEDIDASITQSGFELALKRLYGCGSSHEEDRDPVGLFTTGCWLEMQDLIDSSVESVLRQMTPETLSPLIKLVTSNYYGRAGDKILASAKAMLCRDGWSMPLNYWDGIPGDIIREIVGGDGFFIDGEWDRWLLAKRILDRRLKMKAQEAGLFEPGSRKKVQKAPDTANLMAVRFDTVYRRNGMNSGRGVPDNMHRWITLYTHPDVEPLLVLLDEGIHYVHLEFEKLQLIRNSRDSLGLPVMPEKVISNALWQQMELRQKVTNAREVDMELDLSVKCTEDAAESGASRETTMSIMTPSSPPSSSKGKHKVEDAPHAAEEQTVESGSWDGNGKPRKFWIPSSDCNIVMGGNADPVIATSNNTTLQRHASRLSATIQPEDVQWASDFAAATSQPRQSAVPGEVGADPSIGEVRYTHFPPFRFAAEFPNPRLLKEKKRVYSRTVFYAGSLWNIYIQKVNSSRNKQLGVYLHRAKERETEEVLAGTSGLAQGSVDERIGQLEREMLFRSERPGRRQRVRTTIGTDAADADGTESSGSAGDIDAALNALNEAGVGPSARSNAMRNLLTRSSPRKSDQPELFGSSPPQSDSANFSSGQAGPLTPESESDDTDTENDRLTAAAKRSHVPALPAYVDGRPTIKTYFKIYSPSRGGRMLSIYESAPDTFNFSQSWGWKSSTLMLDEGMLGGEESMGDKEDRIVDGGKGAGMGLGGGRGSIKGKGDGRLRFMVVIGNI